MSKSPTQPYRYNDWLRDVFASVVVFLVALPLCLGIAIASGVPPATGLLTGIIGGLVVATIAGAPLQVSGPAAGLVVLTYDLVRQHGIESLGVVVLGCGLIQVAAGIARLGQWFRAVSPTVIYAMLTGIGILIVAGQIHVMVDDRPRENGIQNLRTIPEAILKGFPWPKPASREINAELAHFLRRFGALHEAQVEIELAVDTHVSEHGTTAEHARQLEGLSVLLQRQQSQLEDWRQTVETLRHSEAVTYKPPELMTAVAAATARIEHAHQDLVEHRGDEIRRCQALAVRGIEDVLAQLKNHDWAAKVGMFTVLVILAWSSMPARFGKAIPASLLAVVLATVTCAMLNLPVQYVEIPERLIDAIIWPSPTLFQDAPVLQLLKLSLMMAVIASAETLLCATAVDRMHSGPRTRYDRELIAQGVGNTLCGVIGALPMTGVIVRSAANVQAGARTRWSAFLHGAWLLVCVVFLGNALRLIPTACLAGILVYTGYKLIGWKTLLRLWREDKSEALIFVATVGLIVGQDLLVGVATGVVLSATKLLIIFSNLRVDLQTDEASRRAHLEITGAATFLRLPMLAQKLEQIPRDMELHVDLARLTYIDHACLELLMQWSEQRESQGGPLFIDWGKLQTRVGSNGQTAKERPPSATATHG